MHTINYRINELIDTLGITKTAFAESLKVSQQYISKLIRTGQPSDLLIDDICEKHNVNEKWLRTGSGKMFIEIDKENQLMDWAGNILKETDDSFKKRFVKMLAELNESDWETLEKMALKIHNKS